MNNSQHFQKVKNGLKPQDIYLTGSSCITDPDFDLKTRDNDNSVYQFAHVVRSAEIITTVEDNIETLFYKVYIDVGCRFLPELISEPQKERQEACASIEASFCSECLTTDKALNEKALKCYALENASYHIWPYWREYLMNMCNRLNLPKISVPTMQIKS
jgi:hypothetical protein